MTELSEEKNILRLHQRIDLLLTLLERGYHGEVKDSIKGLLRRFDITAFAQEDLLRLKNVILKGREVPGDFFSNEPGEVIALWEKDDAERISRILPRIEALRECSEKEWTELIQEVSKIGSAAFYRGEIDRLAPFRVDDTTGIEIEYNQGEKEVRIPAQGDGFKNTTQGWQEVKDSLENFGGTLYLKGIHIHTDRHEQELTPEAEAALMRFIVTYEAVLRLFGAFELDPTLLQQYGKSPQLDVFFTGNRISTHTTYIDWSSRHHTIEFRFFAVPVYADRERFDLERLQLYVYLAKQIMKTVIERPEDFGILNSGLPVVLGMGDKFVSYKYAAKFADTLFKGNLMGKLYFLKLLSLTITEEGKISFRKLGDNWLAEDSVKKYFEENGFGLLAKMHLEQDRWDTDIAQHIMAKVSVLKDQRDVAEYQELGRFLTGVFFFAANTQEKIFAERMLNELGYHLFERIRKIVEGIKDKQLQRDFVRYAIPATLRTSAQRSDEEIIFALKARLPGASSPLQDRAQDSSKLGGIDLRKIRYKVVFNEG